MLIALSLIINCHPNKKGNEIDCRFKTNIDLSKSFLRDIEFNKYKYQGDYIENIRLDSLMNVSYRRNFFDYLSSRNFDQNENEQVFFIKLLLVRIQQTDDPNLYEILNSLFDDENLVYYLEDYELDLFQLFLYKPTYFINNAYRIRDNKLLDYINSNLPSAFFTRKDSIIENIGYINVSKNCILISDKILETFTIRELKDSIKNCETLKAYFLPSSNNGWSSTEEIYYNINNCIIDKLKNQLDRDIYIFYRSTKNSFFQNNVDKVVYYIQDSDGYTNLRKEKNATSEILQQIKSGDQIEVLDNSNDWFLVETKEGKKGYVHKSRIKN